MAEEKIRLPQMDRVNIIGGHHPILMEIADPAPFLDHLSKDELIKIVEVGIKYQNKLIQVEMGRLNAQAEALKEMQAVIHGFK